MQELTSRFVSKKPGAAWKAGVLVLSHINFCKKQWISTVSIFNNIDHFLWSQIVDNIRDSFRGVDFSCHGVVSCLVVGWTTLVIGWSSLVMERPSLVVGWLSLVMGWPSLVMEQSSLAVGWSSLVVVGSSFVVGGNP